MDFSFKKKVAKSLHGQQYPNALVTSPITVLVHPHATGVAVCPALLQVMLVLGHNKAGYMASQVPSGWVGAVIIFLTNIWAGVVRNSGKKVRWSALPDAPRSDGGRGSGPEGTNDLCFGI